MPPRRSPSPAVLGAETGAVGRRVTRSQSREVEDDLQGNSGAAGRPGSRRGLGKGTAMVSLVRSCCWLTAWVMGGAPTRDLVV